MDGRRPDHFDVFMKMLEVIEQDLLRAPAAAHDRVRVTNIIEKIQGTLIVQTVEGDTVMSGDHFENIHNSVIGTRGAKVHGYVELKAARGETVAEAISTLHEALQSPDLSKEKRAEASELLGALTAQASSKDSSKFVLKSIGEGFLKSVEGLASVASVAEKVWPVIQGLWT
jgi:hypothetical protein